MSPLICSYGVARVMPSVTMYYLFDLLGFLRNVIQRGDGLIPMSVEKLHNFNSLKLYFAPDINKMKRGTANTRWSRKMQIVFKLMTLEDIPVVRDLARHI